ncbi:MAG: WD40 repeat domain-containing protein, partial [Thermoguttaceae bacterium]
MHSRSDAPKVLLRAVCPLCRTTVEQRVPAGTAELRCGHCGMRFPYREAAAQRGGAARDVHSADALERWLAGDPMDALPPNNAPRLAHWCRKRRWSAALLAATAALLLVAAVLVVGVYLHGGVQVAQGDGVEAGPELLAPAPEWQPEGPFRQPEEPLRQAAERSVGADRPAHPAADRRRHEAERSRAQAEQARLLAEQRRLEAAWEARTAMGRQPADEPAAHPLRSLFDIGEWLPSAAGAKSPASPPVETVLCEALPAAESPSFAGHEGPILQSVLSPDGRWLATASADATVRLWNLRADPADSEAVVLRGHGGPVTSLAVSSDSHWLASAGFDGTAFLWRLTAENPAKSPIKFR